MRSDALASSGGCTCTAATGTARNWSWWVNPKAGTHFFASGNHGQKIYVVPEQRLIFVRFGKADPYREWEGFFEDLARRIAESEGQAGESRRLDPSGPCAQRVPNATPRPAA